MDEKTRLLTAEINRQQAIKNINNAKINAHLIHIYLNSVNKSKITSIVASMIIHNHDRSILIEEPIYKYESNYDRTTIFERRVDYLLLQDGILRKDYPDIDWDLSIKDNIDALLPDDYYSALGVNDDYKIWIVKRLNYENCFCRCIDYCCCCCCCSNDWVW